jgi:hypothetical protein
VIFILLVLQSYAISSSKISRQEIFDLEQKFQVKPEDEDFQPLPVASGFSHPKFPVLMAEGHLQLLRSGLTPPWVKD